MSEPEEVLVFQLRAAGISGYEREVRWHPTRKWRSDFMFHTQSIIVEIDGGTWASGRHTRGGGFERDAEKHAEAAILGYTVLRFTTGMVMRGEAVGFIERILEARKKESA